MPDDRRTGSGDVAPRKRSDVDVDAGPSASTLGGSFGGSVDRLWRTWDRIPADVRAVLDHHGYAPVSAFITGTSPPSTRRRGDRVFQRASAWAVDRSSLILIDAVRDLEQVDDSRFRPSAPWQLEVRTHPYRGEVRKRTGTVPVDAKRSAATGETQDDPETPDIIDLLPAPVRRQIRTTVPVPEVSEEYLFQGTLKGVPHDHEAGLLRTTSELLIAVLATRAIRIGRRTSHQEAELALASTSWHVETLTAELDPSTRTDLTAHTGSAAIDGAARTGLPPRSTTAELD